MFGIQLKFLHNIYAHMLNVHRYGVGQGKVINRY